MKAETLQVDDIIEYCILFWIFKAVTAYLNNQLNGSNSPLDKYRQTQFPLNCNKLYKE